jgi:predicted amidohydrolase
MPTSFSLCAVASALAAFSFYRCGNAASSAATTCAFSDGGNSSALSPASADLTCSPAAALGIGSFAVSINTSEASTGTYVSSVAFSFAPPPDPHTSPVPVGRPGAPGVTVRVALLGLGADGQTPFNTTLSYLSRAGELGADLAVLPENVRGRPGETGPRYYPAEPLDGPTVAAAAAAAAAWRMYVLLPLRELVPATGQEFNTAVLLNRSGGIVGTYRKGFPVLGNTSGGQGEEGVTPGLDGVHVFAADFGPVAVLTCFDVNFVELWLQAWAGNARLVLWPSAMLTPDPFTHAWAAGFQYYVAAVGYPGELVDMTGAAFPNSTSPDPAYPMLMMADIDLDRTYVHQDYNAAKIAALLAAHGTDIYVEPNTGPPHTPFWLLRSRTPGVRVRPLLAAYEIEDAHEYQRRSRQGINMLRHADAPVPAVGPPHTKATASHR